MPEGRRSDERPTEPEAEPHIAVPTGQKIALVLEYDGTDYFGFQKQVRERTIQAELEQVLYRVTGNPCRVIGAGRTDTGVHARGQVAHFQTNWIHPWMELMRAINALLPQDIAVRRLVPVPAEFHARRSALSRTYRYTIWNRPVRSPLVARQVHHVPHPDLDVAAMQAAACYLLGRHDFASFGSSPTGGHTVREVLAAQWRREEGRVLLDVEANAFLRHMVRSLVGTFLKVGSGRLTPAEFAAILEARDRGAAGPTAPGRGLSLERVRYGPPWQDIC